MLKFNKRHLYFMAVFCCVCVVLIGYNYRLFEVSAFLDLYLWCFILLYWFLASYEHTHHWYKSRLIRILSGQFILLAILAWAIFFPMMLWLKERIALLELFGQLRKVEHDLGMSLLATDAPASLPLFSRDYCFMFAFTWLVCFLMLIPWFKMYKTGRSILPVPPPRRTPLREYVVLATGLLLPVLILLSPYGSEKYALGDLKSLAMLALLGAEYRSKKMRDVFIIVMLCSLYLFVSKHNRMDLLYSSLSKIEGTVPLGNEFFKMLHEQGVKFIDPRLFRPYKEFHGPFMLPYAALYNAPETLSLKNFILVIPFSLYVTIAMWLDNDAVQSDGAEKIALYRDHPVENDQQSESTDQ